jgi:hypothetical protein
MNPKQNQDYGPDLLETQAIGVQGKYGTTFRSSGSMKGSAVGSSPKNTHSPIKYSPEPWSKKREGMNINA